MKITQRCVHHDLVLPFEFDPHLSEFVVCATTGHNVIHNIDVNVIQHHTVPIRLRTGDVIDDVTEDDAVLRRRHFDVCLDVCEIMRSHGDRLGLLH